MDGLKAANLALAFLLEVAMLVAFAWWAITLGGWVGWLVAVIVVAAAIGLWAVYAAPRSSRRLRPDALTWFKIVMFGLAVVAWMLAGQGTLAIVFAALAAANLALARAWGQE